MKPTLSPKNSKLFFYLLSLHIGFKLILGLYISLSSQTIPLLALPPLTLLLTGSDIFVTLFLSALVTYWDGLTRRIMDATIAVSVTFYLFYNLFVYQYFKGFNNWGLIAFLGTDTSESGIGDYLLQKLNIYLLLFLLLISLSVFLSLKQPKFIKKIAAIGLFPLLSFALFSITLSYFLPLSITADLEQNPEFVAIRSLIEQDRYAVPDAPHSSDFHPPAAPLYGTYDNREALKIAPPKQPMNIILLTLESTPYKRTPLAGDTTSTLLIANKLKENSIWFHNYRTPFPNTTRALISMNCSIYPGILHHSATHYNPNFKCNSLPATLKNSGYTTAYFTSSSLSFDAIDKAPFMKDFDIVEDLKTIRKITPPTKTNGIFAIEEEAVLKRIDHFLQTKKTEQPFYMHYFLFWTHNPHELPFEDISSLPIEERFQKSVAYENSIIEELLTILKQRDLLDNTLIVITADHGEAFGEHPLNWVHANFLYDELLKIPLIIYNPHLIKTHTDIYRNGSHLDFAPTILALLGITPQKEWIGQNILSTHFQPKPLLISTRAMRVYNGIIDGNLKYIYNPQTEKEELYNLTDDVDEQHSLIGTKPETVTQSYKTIIEQWLLHNQTLIEANND